MKILILLVSIFLFSFSSLAQGSSSLSEQGRRHWKAASALLDVAKTTDELLSVIQQFEEITKSDPQYADTYYNLGKLYTKVGNEKGEEFFLRAQRNFLKYKELRPNESQTIDDELYVLSVLKDKYLNGPYRFVGRWGFFNDSNWLIDISYNGREYAVTFHKPVKSLVKENETTFLIEEFPKDTDLVDELRRKGWSRYYDDRDADADPGFPTSGTYYYNRRRYSHLNRIVLEGKTPVVIDGYHNWYYFDGSLTHAETIFIPRESALVRIR